MYKNHANGKTNLLRLQGKFRAQTTYDDGTEKVEEWRFPSKTSSFNCNEDQELKLLLRKWRSKSSVNTRIGNAATWEYEIGETSYKNNKAIGNLNESPNKFSENLVVSSTCPNLVADETLTSFHYIVRNCPWPEDNYVIGIDDEKQQFIIRTKNKKYFKRFQIPALVRLNLRLDKNFLTTSYGNNTFKISYRKPSKLLEEDRLERSKLEQAVNRLGEDSAIDCRQS